MFKINISEPIEMTINEFNIRTGPKHKLVLVDFKADWCVLCIKQRPLLEEISVENKGTLELLVIDMEKNPIIAAYFEVDGLPIAILYKNGIMVWDHLGFLGKKELLDIIKYYE